MIKRTLLVTLSAFLTLFITEAEHGRAEPGGPAGPARTASAARVKRSVLYLTHSAGWKHEVLPLSEQILKQIGERGGAFEVTATQDCSLLSRDNLKRYDAIVFYTTGELPLTDEQKAAFLDFIKSGKGFVGIHSATDTFYKWPEYGELIGGYFDQHPWHQEVTVKVEDPHHAATRHLGSSFKINDEIYQFKDFSRDRVHVVLSLDAGSVDLTLPAVHRRDKDFALAWWRNYGRGRVFYTALGHRAEVWQDDRFQQHLLGALRWAMGEK
ncbi:MAG TPA: ThuA domain-containing protein [Blastocatellia bacterium]|nr:ThuA domain-containing protein [Blastocatellia bacterium]